MEFFPKNRSSEGVINRQLFVFISLITRMRYKRDIKMGRLCTPGGAVIGIVGGGVTFRFFLIVRLFLTKICYFGYVCTLLWLS